MFTEILQVCRIATSFLFCGDWNVVQNKSDNTYNVIHDRNQNARKKIEELKETFELLDPWRTCYPVDKKFTWHQTSPIKQSRIDYFLVSEDIFQLLRDSNYIDIVKTCIRDTLSEYYSVGNIDDFLHVELLCNDQVFFEILKMKIRSVSIAYSITKSQDEKEKNIKT